MQCWQREHRKGFTPTTHRHSHYFYLECVFLDIFLNAHFYRVVIEMHMLLPSLLDIFILKSTIYVRFLSLMCTPVREGRRADRPHPSISAAEGWAGDGAGASMEALAQTWSDSELALLPQQAAD